MPNPLTRLLQTPSKTATDRPSPIPPRLESVEGQNFAYRGTETHGVTPTAKSEDPLTDDAFDALNPDGRAVFVPAIDHPKDEDPIPVRIVTEFKREIKAFSTDRRIAVWNRADEIVGRDENRISLTIKNISSDKALFIGYSRETIFLTGYPLYASQERTLTTEDPVYVAAWGTSDADNCDYAWIVEYVKPDQ